MTYLVLNALTRLQAGKDLALNCLDPEFPLLIRRCFEVPRLTRQRHNDELKGILLLWKTQINKKFVLKQHTCWCWILTLQVSATAQRLRPIHVRIHDEMGFCWTPQHSNGFLAPPVQTQHAKNERGLEKNEWKFSSNYFNFFSKKLCFARHFGMADRWKYYSAQDLLPPLQWKTSQSVL